MLAHQGTPPQAAARHGEAAHRSLPKGSEASRCQPEQRQAGRMRHAEVRSPECPSGPLAPIIIARGSGGARAPGTADHPSRHAGNPTRIGAWQLPWRRAPTAPSPPEKKRSARYNLVPVLRRPGQPWKGVPPMDTQTVLALCAIFSVVLGMIGISQRRK